MSEDIRLTLRQPFLQGFQGLIREYSFMWIVKWKAYGFPEFKGWAERPTGVSVREKQIMEAWTLIDTLNRPRRVLSGGDILHTKTTSTSVRSRILQFDNSVQNDWFKRDEHAMVQAQDTSMRENYQENVTDPRSVPVYCSSAATEKRCGAVHLRPGRSYSTAVDYDGCSFQIEFILFRL